MIVDASKALQQMHVASSKHKPFSPPAYYTYLHIQEFLY